MIKYKKGDLIKAALKKDVDVIVHGANCFHAMGAGIAKQIKNVWPGAYDVDLNTKKADKNKLGTITEFSDGNVIIINAYTQYTYWDPTKMLDYNAIEKCLKLVLEKYKDKIIGLPKIGAGLARGNWDKIEEIINRVSGEKIIYVYTLE